MASRKQGGWTSFLVTQNSKRTRVEAVSPLKDEAWDGLVSLAPYFVGQAVTGQLSHGESE